MSILLHIFMDTLLFCYCCVIKVRRYEFFKVKIYRLLSMSENCLPSKYKPEAKAIEIE